MAQRDEPVGVWQGGPAFVADKRNQCGVSVGVLLLIADSYGIMRAPFGI